MLTQTRTSMLIAALPVAAALALVGPAAAAPPAAKAPRPPVVKHGSHRAGPPAVRHGRRSSKRRAGRSLARIADYGYVRSECNHSAVGGGGVLTVGFNSGYPFGYAPGQQFYARTVAYVGSTFVALGDWKLFTAWNGGATGYSPSANTHVIGGTGAPGTGLSNDLRVPGRTWAAGGVETWTQSGGFRYTWIPPQAWGMPVSGAWCYFA